MSTTNAKLCSSCARGDKCIICGRYGAKVMAYLCSSCGFGSKGDQCAKCGRSMAKAQAYLCSSCAIKYKDKCLKCGRHI